MRKGKPFIAVLSRYHPDRDTLCGNFASGTIGTITPYSHERGIEWFFNPQGTSSDFGFFVDFLGFHSLAFVGDFSVVNGEIVNGTNLA